MQNQPTGKVNEQTKTASGFHLSPRAETSISNLVGSTDKVGDISLRQLVQANLDREIWNEIFDYANQSSYVKQSKT